MRVLLTGSSGRVGGAIATRLAGGHSVIGLDRRPGPCTTHVGAVTDRALVAELLADADAVVHTASLHAPHVGQVPDDAFVATNVRGTETLLRACLEHGVRRFIYTSTTSLYGHSLVPDRRAVFVTEDLQPRPRDVYDSTKVAAENACAAACGPELGCVALRIARCFPEPDWLVAAYRLHRGVDLRDVAEAHRLALEAPPEGFRVFNIAAQSPFAAHDAEELLSDAPAVIARRCPSVIDAFRARSWALPQRIDRVYVIERARAQLGYRPLYNYDALLPTPAA